MRSAAAIFSSSGRSKNARAADIARRRVSSGTPWFTSWKKPTDSHARRTSDTTRADAAASSSRNRRCRSSAPRDPNPTRLPRSETTSKQPSSASPSAGRPATRRARARGYESSSDDDDNDHDHLGTADENWIVLPRRPDARVFGQTVGNERLSRPRTSPSSLFPLALAPVRLADPALAAEEVRASS